MMRLDMILGKSPALFNGGLLLVDFKHMSKCKAGKYPVQHRAYEFILSIAIPPSNLYIAPQL